MLLGVVAPKIPPTLLLRQSKPQLAILQTKLGDHGVVGGPWLSPYHTPYSKGYSKRSAFAPFQWCPHPKGRFAAIRGCSSHTMA